jgi:hypothetical protein
MCVPYLLLSIFADFLHVHPLTAGLGIGVGVVHEATYAPPSTSRHIPESSCAICQWQRVGTRLQPMASFGPATPAPQISVTARVAAFPDSPIPHPRAFRGPPSLSLS